MNTQESNKLIAEFMGLDYYPPNDWKWIDNKSYFTKDLAFHESWDWLMPVVNKISKAASNYEFESPEHEKFEEIFIECENWFLKADIDSVYGAAVEFITWYREQG